MGVQPDARSFGVVLKHTLYRCSIQGHSIGVLSLSTPGMRLQYHPQMICTGGRFNPDFRQVEIQESQQRRRQMHETIAPIARLGARTVLVIGAKPDMDALLAKIQVREMHPQQLTEPKSSLFEHQADQPVAKARRISLWGTRCADGVHKRLELLLRNGGWPAYWLFHPYLHPLCVKAATGVGQQIPLNGPLSPGTSNIHHG